MSRIKVVNETQYDTTEVRSIVKRVLADFECKNVCVRVIHRRRNDGYSGGRYRGYWYPSRKEDRPQILVSLPKPGVALAPYTPYQRRGAPETFELRDWREALVALVAHEANHHRQARKRKGMVEVECDWAAQRAVRRWREAVA